MCARVAGSLSGYLRSFSSSSFRGKPFFSPRRRRQSPCSRRRRLPSIFSTPASCFLLPSLFSVIDFLYPFLFLHCGTVHGRRAATDRLGCRRLPSSVSRASSAARSHFMRLALPWRGPALPWWDLLLLPVKPYGPRVLFPLAERKGLFLMLCFPFLACRIPSSPFRAFIACLGFRLRLLCFPSVR
jgi:hypothetical protein